MCGIAGMFSPRGLREDAELAVRRMLSSLRHRGPDQFGLYVSPECALGNARLSIIDLGGGQQPIANEDESLWIVFNGEVFNYVELRPELEQLGHRFKTSTDTEVILHLYEEYGSDCLSRLNGQFAIAIWDTRRRELFLARDRLGVRPLFYTRQAGTLYFGSEIKAIFNAAPFAAEINPSVLTEVFTYWSPLPGHTVFRDVVELPPGHYLLAHEHNVTPHLYWQMGFAPDASGAGRNGGPEDVDGLVDEFRSLLVDAARIRLRADVPVGAYLSGGLDSSAIAAVIRNYTSNRLNTFSIAFTDENFDEREHQQRMAAFLGTQHETVEATHADIGRVFPEVVWHTETPIMRTSPAPMFLLSRLVRKCGFKVVLTGEGADEFLGGYGIFKEAKIRRFWARQPNSAWRPRLLRRLYPDIARLGASGGAYLEAFFRVGFADTDRPDYSHFIRWKNNRRTCRFFSDAFRADVGSDPPSIEDALRLPRGFAGWGGLEKAQFLEVTVFMSEYLLSSQGDRPAMAHSVEGRYPFLDFRVVDFCNRLPSRLKLRGLQEKYLLRKLAARWLPPEIAARRKRPYRAPIHRSFFHAQTPDYVRELLSENDLKQSCCFKPAAVQQLVAKLDQGKTLGETDDMALAGILSTQLVWSQFVRSFRRADPLGPSDDVKVCRQNSPTQEAACLA